MNFGQACIVGALYGSIVVGLALELLGYRRRNASDDQGADDTGADWSGEAAFIDHGEGL